MSSSMDDIQQLRASLPTTGDLRSNQASEDGAPYHVSTHDINPNGMTKTVGPTDFLYFRHHLFTPSIRKRKG